MYTTETNLTLLKENSMQVKKHIPVALLCIICMVLFYYFGPKREKIKIVEREVIIEKEVIVTKRDVVTVTVTEPDGTITVTEKDKSIIESETDKETAKDKLTIKTPLKDNWSIGLGTIITPSNGALYVTIERRILANISIGVMATTTRTVGAHVSFRF